MRQAHVQYRTWRTAHCTAYMQSSTTCDWPERPAVGLWIQQQAPEGRREGWTDGGRLREEGGKGADTILSPVLLLQDIQLGPRDLESEQRHTHAQYLTSHVDSRQRGCDPRSRFRQSW
eukprot:161069-Rhodomonas_salina.1